MAGFGSKLSIGNVKVRAMFDGTSGSGKTVSAIRFAIGLAGGDQSKVGAIDSENGRMDRYALAFPGISRETMPNGYAPDEYIKLIELAARAGLEVLVIDSVSHEWTGRGGIMDTLDRLGNRNGNPWATVTPLHRKFTDAIMTAPFHVVMTCRTDTEWSYDKEQRGNRMVLVPRKVGTKIQQRPGFEYDLDIWFRLDDEHRALTQKTNFDLIFPSRVDVSMITEEHGQKLRDWLATVTPDQAARIEASREEGRRQAEAADQLTVQDVRDAIDREMFTEQMGGDTPDDGPPPDAATGGSEPEPTFEVCAAQGKDKPPCGARLYPMTGETYRGKSYRARSIIGKSREQFGMVLCGKHLEIAEDFRAKKNGAAATAG